MKFLIIILVGMTGTALGALGKGWVSTPSGARVSLSLFVKYDCSQFKACPQGRSVRYCTEKIVPTISMSGFTAGGKSYTLATNIKSLKKMYSYIKKFTGPVGNCEVVISDFKKYKWEQLR